MRKLKRYDDMKAEIAAMPIKLSAKDKNLVALFWLLEIVLTAIVAWMMSISQRTKKRCMSRSPADCLAMFKMLFGW